MRLNPYQAIDVLKKGEYQIRPGAGPKEMWGKMGYESWYNQYLLEKDDEGQENISGLCGKIGRYRVFS